MKTIKSLFAFAIIISALSFTYPQTDPDNKIVLSSLATTNSSLEKVANGIEDHISAAPHGYLWPVSKMVFSKTDGKLTVTVTAIDNSWFQLFGVGEKPYGYLVAKGRLYIVSANGDDEIDFTQYFKKTGIIRAFSRPEMTIALFKECPTWTYEIKNCELIARGTSNLDLLNKEDSTQIED